MMIHFPFRRSLTTTLSLVLLVAPVAAQWRAEERIDGTGQSFAPMVVVDDQHHYALFDNFQNNAWTTFLAWSHDGGRTAWSRRALTYRKWARFHAEGELVVIATGQQGTGGGHGGGGATADYFWAEVSQDGGETFTLVNLGTPTLFDLWGYPAVRIDGRRVFVYWSEDGGVHLLQQSTDGGVTWLPSPRVIPHRLVHETFAVVGDDLHSLEVVQNASYESRLWYRRSLDGGLTWSTQRLDQAPTGTNVGEARLTVSAGRLCAVWNQSPVWNVRDIFFSTSTDGGTTWSVPVRVNDAQPADTAVAPDFDFAATGESLLVAYTQRDPGNGNIADLYARHSGDGGATWNDSVRVNPVPSMIGYPMNDPRCAITGQRASVTWIDPLVAAPGNDYMMGAVSRDGGQTWTTQPLSGGKVWESQEYGLAYDAEGAVVVAFEKETAHVSAVSMHQPDLLAQGDLSGGTPITFDLAHAELGEDGAFAIVLVSWTGPGTVTGGLDIGGGRTVPLDFDALTLLGTAQLAPFFTTTVLVGGAGSTPTLNVPPALNLPPIWAAAVVIDSSGQAGSMTDALRVR